MDSEDEGRRKSDIQLAILQQEFRDFRLGYEKDVVRSQISCETMMQAIKDHDEFIKDIRPVYAKGMVALGAASLGTIGIFINWLWKHLSWVIK